MYYIGQTCCLSLLVTSGKWPGLLGHNWFSNLHLNLKELAQQHQVHQVICDDGPVSQPVLGGAGET